MESQFAAESGHWYTLAGEPMYELLGKNGQRRSTTLRDARQRNLVPSVTTIIKCAAAPGLERWKAEQMMLSALTLPRSEGEAETDWLSRVRHDSRETARKAAERGTNIHAAIECAFRGKPHDYREHVQGTQRRIAEICGSQTWHPERSFAHAMGYGGKCDLHSAGWVLDFKTKEFGEDRLPTTFDEHTMQLGAYRRGLGVPAARCGIVFVSASVPGLVHFEEVTAERLERGLAMFDCLLGYWQCMTGHRPQQEAA